MKVEIITPDADPDRGGFGARVHALISMFSQFADVRVTLTTPFNGQRVPEARYSAIPLREGLRTKIRRLNAYYRTDFPRRAPADPPDLVVVESLDLLGLHQYGPHVPLILDEHNVYWNLLRYEIVNSPFFRTWLGRRPSVRRRLIPGLLERAKRFEAQAILCSARTLVTSEVDRRAVLEECPEAAFKVRVLPNCVDTRQISSSPERPDSKRVVFVGSFNYLPNRQAAEFIADTLAPALPWAQFTLVGGNPPSVARRAPNVEVMGHVPDISLTLQESAVCIAPLAHGSGTRIKILTYLAAGRAVVATTKACEGLPVRDADHLLIRNEPAEFLGAVRELLEDPARRRRLGSNGRRLVESEFDWRVHVGWLRDFSADICTEASLGRPGLRQPVNGAGGQESIGPQSQLADSGPLPTN